LVDRAIWRKRDNENHKYFSRSTNKSIASKKNSKNIKKPHPQIESYEKILGTKLNVLSHIPGMCGSVTNNYVVSDWLPDLFTMEIYNYTDYNY
jgi:hypothetical protein